MHAIPVPYAVNGLDQDSARLSKVEAEKKKLKWIDWCEWWCVAEAVTVCVWTNLRFKMEWKSLYWIPTFFSMSLCLAFYSFDEFIMVEWLKSLRKLARSSIRYNIFAAVYNIHMVNFHRQPHTHRHTRSHMFGKSSWSRHRKWDQNSFVFNTNGS